MYCIYVYVILHTTWVLSVVTHAPFHASVLRPASQVGPMHKAAGMGKLVNAALLSLINEACVLYVLFCAMIVCAMFAVCLLDDRYAVPRK